MRNTNLIACLLLLPCLLNAQLPGALDPTFAGTGFATFDFSKARATACTIAVLPGGNILAGGKVEGGGFCMARFKPDGAPDSLFGLFGTVLFPQPDSVSAMAVQSDGKILAADQNLFGVTRFLTNGASDTSFGNQASSSAYLNAGSQSCTAVAAQPDGKIYLGGRADFQAGTHLDGVLVRLLPDGEPDKSFGVNGFVSLDFSGYDDIILFIEVQPDGKILTLGATFHPLSYGDFALARYHPDGSLDSTFGFGGKTRTNFFFPAGSEIPSALLLQPDGKIVAVGNLGTAPVLARYNPDGKLDETFGIFGHVIAFNQPSFNRITSAALRPDGKIVLAGTAGDPPELAFLQYLSNGVPDSTFGAGGMLTTGQKTESTSGPRLALSPDGAISVAVPSPNGLPPVFTVCRYLPGGAPDPAFSDDGATTTLISGGNDRPTGLAVQPDGKVLVGGNGRYDGSPTALLLRIGTEGSPDLTFGINGLVYFGHTSVLDELADIAVQPDGKIIVAGTTYDAGFISRIFIRRFNPDGTPDLSFNGTGTQVFIKSNDHARAIAVQPDGKILVAGTRKIGPGWDFLLLRLNTNGAPDNSFGQSGAAVTDFLTNDDVITDIALQPDGRIVAAGQTYPFNYLPKCAMARYHPNGMPDVSFAAAGQKIIDPPAPFSAFVHKVLVQPDGKILVSGLYNNPIGPFTAVFVKYRLYRLFGDGSADPTFGDAGTVSNGTGPLNAALYDMALQPNGKILLANSEYDSTPVSINFVLRRLNTDGSPDTGFGDNGVVSTTLGRQINIAQNMAYLPETASSGKIICSGYVADYPEHSYHYDFAVARYFSGQSVNVAEPLGSPVFSILPNPASEFIELQLTSDPGAKARVSLYDAGGRLLRSGALDNNRRWDLRDLPAGVYCIQIQSGGASRAERFVKR